MALIRFKRGTVAQLQSAASANDLVEGEPYFITDVGGGMIAVGTGVDSYVFSGVLVLEHDDPVPSGYVGMIARLPAP